MYRVTRVHVIKDVASVVHSSDCKCEAGQSLMFACIIKLFLQLMQMRIGWIVGRCSELELRV